ncbi:MAG TPA: DUF4252 domain-containing protein [Steroidobacteraceae bacterium]|jgi:hypothetical protein|nr:DUF4252 domain-containing protein [Steroidobacteraceae bacterium]
MNARVVLTLTALLVAGPVFAQSKGQIRIPEFAALADKASESVNVSLDASLLGMGCRFLNAEDPEQAAAKKLCTGLTGIYVRHYEFDKDFAYPKVDIEGMRQQLSGPGWSRIVEARSKKENTNVDVFVLIDGGKAKGLSIIASEPREFTIVNIVGSIELEQLHDLEGKFSIPNLEIETGQKPKPAKP